MYASANGCDYIRAEAKGYQRYTELDDIARSLHSSTNDVFCIDRFRLMTTVRFSFTLALRIIVTTQLQSFAAKRNALIASLGHPRGAVCSTTKQILRYAVNSVHETFR